MTYSLHLRPPNTPIPIQNAIKTHNNPPASIEVCPIVAAIPEVGVDVADPTMEDSLDEALPAALLTDVVETDNDENDEESMLVVLVTEADVDCVVL